MQVTGIKIKLHKNFYPTKRNDKLNKRGSNPRTCRPLNNWLKELYTNIISELKKRI